VCAVRTKRKKKTRQARMSGGVVPKKEKKRAVGIQKPLTDAIEKQPRRSFNGGGGGGHERGSGGVKRRGRVDSNYGKKGGGKRHSVSHLPAARCARGPLRRGLSLGTNSDMEKKVSQTNTEPA